MLKRVSDWVQARLDAAVMRHVQAFARESAESIDYERLALHVTTLKEFMRDLAERTATSEDMQRAVSRQVADRVIDQFDTDPIVQQVADTISAEDVAYHMDAEDVAGYVEVDADTIAEKVAEDIDVSECVDYDKLAEALVSKLKEAWA